MAFIGNEDTQTFLEEHISEDKEWWIGITYASSNETNEGKKNRGQWCVQQVVVRILDTKVRGKL